MTQFYLNCCLRPSLLHHSFPRKRQTVAIGSFLFLFLCVLLCTASAKPVHPGLKKAATTFENVQILPGDVPEGNDVPGFTKVIGGQNFRFVFPASNYTGWFDDISNGTFGGLYVYENGTNDGTHFTLASPVGYSFDLNSFQYISDREDVALTLTLTYTNNTTTVQNYTLDGNSTVQTLAGLGTLANDIKSIEFVSDKLLYYNNLDVTDVKTTAVLPVRLIDFAAKKQERSIVLQWQTAMEQNAKDFVVQHSLDGYSWEQLGTIAAHQHTTTVRLYTFIHPSPVAGMHYYRLLQRDLDGKESYSKIVPMEWNQPVRATIVYPNPVSNGVLRIVLQKEGVVAMYNNIGAMVLQERLPAGAHALDVHFLAKGFYAVQVNGERMTVVLQ